ncbi:conserved hypothetical protein [Histoplasma capsulatum H143]|uniref:ARB-07466-like C-terminal domain-containing protein n=1 Tax=Ajellomyces capsulatus (strain H143) TaxID=544712 RepID=C6HQG9_AJECH|nr:conserved hypothetical protein [Histoplasma capsulatum H143]
MVEEHGKTVSHCSVFGGRCISLKITDSMEALVIMGYRVILPEYINRRFTRTKGKMRYLIPLFILTATCTPLSAKSKRWEQCSVKGEEGHCMPSVECKAWSGVPIAGDWCKHSPNGWQCCTAQLPSFHASMAGEDDVDNGNDDYSNSLAKRAPRSCNARGVPGICIKKSACKGIATPGAGTPEDPWTCPHDPNDVMCCTDKKPPPPPPAGPSVRIPEYRCKRHVIDAGYKIMGANPGKVRSVGCYGRRSGKSEHPLGLALDLMTGALSPNGQPLAEWVMFHAIELKVKYAIWGQRIWEAGESVRGWAQWEKMEDRGGLTANHWDHVHVSFRP